MLGFGFGSHWKIRDRHFEFSVFAAALLFALSLVDPLRRLLIFRGGRLIRRLLLANLVKMFVRIRLGPLLRL